MEVCFGRAQEYEGQRQQQSDGQNDFDSLHWPDQRKMSRAGKRMTGFAGFFPPTNRTVVVTPRVSTGTN
jgi:hypothetical protein